MITDFTQATLDCGVLAMLLGEMAYFKTSNEAFDRLRPEALRFIRQVPCLDGLELPETREAMTDTEEDVLTSVLGKLSELRSRVGGEVLPLTVFMLTHCVYKATFFAAFDDKDSWPPYRDLLKSCFQEIGLNPEAQIAVIETKSRAAVVVEQNGERSLRDTDRIATVTDLLQSIWEALYRRWSEPLDVSDQIAALQQSIQTFRKESNDFFVESARREQEILEQLGLLRGQLIERLKYEGIPEAQAEEITDAASETFRDRLQRWASNQKAQDAVEAALWAALDFVPLGTVGKLGLKVAAAVRKATKG